MQPTIARQIPAILVAATLVGLIANAASPRPAALTTAVYAAAESGAGACHVQPRAVADSVPRIDINAASALCLACTAGFVDARSANSFAAGHILGALHLPPMGDEDEATALMKLRSYSTIIVYDGEPTCGLADNIARRLLADGFEDVRVLAGGWPAWRDAGGPGQSGACPVCSGLAEAVHP